MKFKIPLYLAILLFSTFFLTGCTSKENINISNGLVEEGQGFYKEREYKKATEKFVEALEAHPSNAEAYLFLTEVFLDKGYFKEVENLADEASKRISKESSSEIYTMIGDKYYEMKEISNAKNIYEKGLSNDGSKVGLAKVYIHESDFEKARKTLKGAEGHQEYALLVAYLSLQDWEVGSSFVTEIDLNNIEDEVVKERVSNLREIYAIDDKDALHKDASLAGEYINSGYFTLALKILNDQVDKIEEYGDAQYFLGRAYVDSGDYEKAIEKLQKAILLDKDTADVYVTLARAYLFDKDTEKALDMYKQAVSKAKDDEREFVTWEYVNVLVDNKMINVAKNVVLDLLKDRDSINMNIILAEIYYQQKDLVSMNKVLLDIEAKSNLTQSETKDLTRYRLLYSLEDIKNVEEIENLMERFSVFDRYNPEFYLLKGKLLRHQENNAEAKEALERAIELDLEGDIADKATKLLATID